MEVKLLKNNRTLGAGFLDQERLQFSVLCEALRGSGRALGTGGAAD